MVCPLLASAILALPDEADESYKECIQKRCAWWDMNCNWCALMTIARHL